MSTTTPPTTNEAWTTLITSIKSTLPTSPLPTFKPTSPHTPSSIASTIDHTLLSLSATPDQVTALCTEASTHNFATVCVRLPHVALAVQNLKGHSPPVGVACVVGFHEGTCPTPAKCKEAKDAVEAGASELDMVLNREKLQAKDYVSVYEDIHGVRKASAEGGVKLKVILETGRLESEDDVIAGCVVSCLAGADFVKTSTGFDGPGATVESVGLMRRVVDSVSGGRVRVKASGGVRTAADAIKMVEAGAERIGASAGVKLVKEMEGSGGEEGKADPGGY
ncbi:hypothetical protein FQN54_004413 [Arachnomyces sp. PD_36]|nr:hypothetical protein FQN54_004413 [Arachnomyces sp. PD_36]